MRRITALLGVVAMVAVAAAPAGARQTEGRDYRPLSVGHIDRTLMPALADPDRTVTVMVELEGDPVAVARAAARDAGRDLSKAERAALRRSLKATQNGLKGRIGELEGRVLGQYADAYNGIKVRVPARSVPQLASLPGVKGVHGIERQTPDNATSVPFLGTPAVWDSLGLTGQGVKIAIIDTGIDYTHANFGGSGDPDDYATNDPTVIESGTFPTTKVAGGWDFVGDDYDASSDDPAVNTPMPDPDPLDCNGHGSHVAGTAAGYGVLADGSTYGGPYDTTTHTNSFLIGPGMAPEAELYALKVFGCDGSTDVTVDAIDWAVANDMDVINMSLGSPFGRADDPSAVAATNAVAAGVIVVASAGNSGSSPYITGSPGSATGAISVAAMDTIESTPHANYVTADDTVDMQNSNGADLSTPITAEVLVLSDDPTTVDVDESLGCNLSDYPADSAGKILVTFRGTCARIDRAVFGQQLGAAAVVFINNTDGFPPFEGPIAGVTIPFLGALQADTDRIVAADGTSVTIEDGGAVANPTYRDFAGFSSGGPRNGDSAAKPDVIAPGVSIISTFVGSGTGSLQISGTSMSSPHVAGMAALVREAHPNWHAADIKAAIVNTANPNAMVNYLTTRAGAGVVQPQGAVATNVVATGNNPLTASLSFGYEESTGAVTNSRKITVKNHGNHPVTFATGVEWNTDAGGAASMTVSPAMITVPAHATRKVKVTLSVNGAAVPPGFQTASGNVTLTPVAGTDVGLRVPFVEVIRGASSLTTSPRSVFVPKSSSTATLTTANGGGATGTADVYAWGLSDPRDATVTDVRAVGVQAFPDFDIGVFAINTNRRNSNPAVNEWDVLLDVDEDGAFDYGVIGFDIGAVFSGFFDGRLGSLTIDLSDGSILAAFFAGGGLDTSTVLLPFPLSVVGLSSGVNEDFDYISAVFSLEGFADDFVDGVGSFNAYHQPVETGQFLVLGPGDADRWTADVNRLSLLDNPTRGWMVVYTENKTGSHQADLVRLRVQYPKPGKKAPVS